MNIKTILALCAMASMATAAPAEELEKRACSGNRFCCETFFPFNFLFIRAVGSNCIGPTSATCPAGKTEHCCTSNLPLSNGNLACTQL
ncbi:hypothetical protein P875_00033739 [Aspergillus parasiticus SU-1]|uniref:Uncharacterized protein n=1 Tax=Aspergillus parasiticus (strain ATCC 56775 / NRRL 5862 / SRRC 143 / SU-1) TaxID=1403190 RepID=A0A0F0I9Q2_ASPPU|nr:hypothetical protein P875_00033739 [Aspergillus parasiticus SU-1]